MNKKLLIKVEIQEDKVATAIKTNGYDLNSMSDQLEILGILENLKQVQSEKIKELRRLEK